MKRAYLIILLAFVGLESCSETTEPSLESWTKPGVGSSYTFVGWELDSLGRVDSLSKQYQTFQVLATGFSYAGQSDVFVMMNSTKDSLFFRYDEKNDFIVFYSNEFWLKYPVYSKQTNILPTKDTTYSTGTRYVTTRSITNEGIETLTLAGITFQTARLRDNEIQTEYSPGFPTQRSVQDDYYWFAPKLGFIARYKSTHTTYNDKDSIIYKPSGYLNEIQTYTIVK